MKFVTEADQNGFEKRSYSIMDSNSLSGLSLSAWVTMICLRPWTRKYTFKKRFKKKTLMPSTVLKKVLEAQTMAEDYEVYIPFFSFLL